MTMTLSASLGTILNCCFCGTEFGKEHSQQKYCSKSCQSRASNRRLASYKQKWVEENSEKVAEQKKAYANANREKRVEQTERWRKANMSYYTQYSRLRYAQLQQAKLKSLTKVDEYALDEWYNLARKLGLEVDHIVPLKHKKVCGLHVPWNMQLLSRTDNAARNNNFSDDVVGIIREKEAE